MARERVLARRLRRPTLCGHLGDDVFNAMRPQVKVRAGVGGIVEVLVEQFKKTLALGTFGVERIADGSPQVIPSNSVTIALPSFVWEEISPMQTTGEMWRGFSAIRCCALLHKRGFE